MRRFVQAFFDAEAFADGIPDDVVAQLAGAPPHYNIGKQGSALAWTASEEGSPQVAALTWGLVPRWSKCPSTPYTTVTARIDRAPRSRLFADAWQKRRCVVPMTGYFKWDRQRRPPWPMFVQRQDGLALLAAGVWERWQDPDGTALDTFSILTGPNTHIPSPLSPDGPVFVDPAVALAWLDGTLCSAPQLQRGARTPALEACYVGLGIRDLHRDDYTLLEPVDPPQPAATVDADGDEAASEDDEDA